MQNETQKEIAGIQSATSRQNTKDQVYAQNEMSSRRRHTRFDCDWSSDVCSSDLLHRVVPQDHALEKSLDSTTIIPACRDAIEHAKPVTLSLPIRNVHRTVGTMLGYHITKRWGGAGLPDDTIRIHFTGSAGQSFGAFVPPGVTFTLEGAAIDYSGNWLSGGSMISLPSLRSTC